MAKMFGILKSPFQGSPGRTAKTATRTGEEQLTAELNNLGRGSTAGGKTMVVTTLFEDGSGFFKIRRENREVQIRWTADERPLLAFASKDASRLPGQVIDVMVEPVEVSK